MTRFRILILVSALSLLASNAFADGPKLREWCSWRITEGLLKPLAKKESKRSRFSRGEPVPAERRTRVLAEELSLDAQERAFLPFAVDARYGDGEWSEDMNGCVYRASGSIYIAVGDDFFPAEYLLGKRVEPVAGVCRAKKP